ncbi:DUF6644 family protein [Pseudohongiella acticola]|jgi:Family of unknown function (DUF6644)|uniref:DUF6644 family protein n=1 Tax=Pseudohongiella acticola TaxID=1524254 RepID=UPI0030EE1D33|tara:strand:- start:32 stop:514 length:483 start_codon:yes stop_codon:yes gene_type:complete
MLQHEFWLNLEYTWLAEQIGATWLFPLFNSLHVISITLMLGALLMLDLRLAGVAARVYPYRLLSRDFLPWIWLAFSVATITGIGLFITRASAHVLNPAFQWKMLLMLMAGVNMLIFHHRSVRLAKGWDRTIPLSIRLTGIASLVLWAGVMLGGRWMGHII